MTATGINSTYPQSLLGLFAGVLLISLISLVLPSNVLAAPKGPGGKPASHRGRPR